MSAQSPFAEPTITQLVEAVAGYLEKTALPHLEGHAAFHGRVAINVLGAIKRELQEGPAALAAEEARLGALLAQEGGLNALRWALVAAIRNGEMTAQTPGLLDHLLKSAMDRVAIEQPGYGALRFARAALA
jgi:hypothetical protein